MTLQELSDNLKEIESKVSKHYSTKPQLSWGELPSGREGWIEPEGYKQSLAKWKKEEDALWKERESIYAQIKKANTKVEIKNPGKLIGGRATTSYMRLDSLYVNDLLHITLSDSKQEGNVVMPYKIDFEGNVSKIKREREYRIKRIGNKVYWLVSDYDLLRY